MPLFSLNAANPFSSGASISFSVSKGMNTVRLAIYSVDGKLVTRLVDGKKPEGNYRVRWNATGRPTGLYVCRLEAGGKRLYKKLVLIR
jgi:hypothetical protein